MKGPSYPVKPLQLKSFLAHCNVRCRSVPTCTGFAGLSIKVLERTWPPGSNIRKVKSYSIMAKRMFIFLLSLAPPPRNDQFSMYRNACDCKELCVELQKHDQGLLRAVAMLSRARIWAKTWLDTLTRDVCCLAKMRSALMLPPNKYRADLVVHIYHFNLKWTLDRK